MKLARKTQDTDTQAISYIKVIIKAFEPLNFLSLSDQDREIALQARKSLENIINTNGYELSCGSDETIKEKAINQ